ncbi:MAG: dienelactone hydrolase family protein [Roseiflexaceae bacterium]
MKRVLKVIGWVAGVIAVLILGLVISIPIDGLFAASRLTAVANLQIPNPNGPTIQAYVARPATPGPHPAVIMVHEWWGLNPAITGMADALAAEGYLVIAPDLFRGSSTSWIPRAIYQVSTTPAEQINLDLDAVHAWLRQQPDVDTARIGVIGFCFGGRASLLYSIHNPDGIAATGIFYGMATTDPAQLAALRSPVLGIFGGADTSIPLDEVQALEAGLVQAGIEQTITVYPDQPHAFVRDAEAIAQPGAARDAWLQLLGFLDTNLKQAAAGGEIPASATPAGWADPTALSPFGLVHHALVCGIKWA